MIEKIGVDRSMEAAKDCDVALYVLDDSKPMTEEDRRAMGAALAAPCDGSLLTNARQAGAILRAKKSVDSAVQSLRAGMTPDAVLVDLESAMDALGEVTGRTMREDVTNRIFERFCVGK